MHLVEGPTSAPRAPWRDERYEPIKLLGRGSFGDVYLVHDRVRNERVALKWLRAWDERSMADLRREFRLLRDVAHPNLVAFHELHARPDGGFLTMEAVDGIDLGAFVRAAPSLDERRARIHGSLGQVVDAVDTLHRGGAVHRDLKPSNILVTKEGRAVVLDAGLAKNLDSQQSSNPSLSGTLAYMSPEQALGKRLTFASDWYSLGVIAFELFADQLPFVGPSMEAFRDKLLGRAPLLRDVRADVPEAEARIIDRLLSLDPDARPNVDELRSWLGSGALRRAPMLAPHAHAPLVGRQDELAVLRGALSRATRGGFASVLVRGPSGIGKTTLARAFLSEPETSSERLVLTARCYQREMIPFAGLEEVLDTLFGALRDQPLPEGALSLDEQATLALVFAGAPRLAREVVAPPDPREQSRLLARAVSSIVRHVAGERGVVLWMDDLQWAADEVASVLVELSRGAWPAGFLLVVGSRPPAEGDTLALGSLVAALEAPVTMTLGPISDDSATQLVTTLAAGTRSTPDAVRRVVQGASGHPLLLVQAARHLSSLAGTPRLDLRDILRTEVARVRAGDRRLLDIVCIATEPLAETVALAAAGLPGEADAARRLCALGLVRRVGVMGDALEPFHDRLREIVREGLAGEQQRACNLAIADALDASQASRATEPETIVAYLLAAGEHARASPRISSAVERLARGLAFARAADLLKLAIASAPAADAGAALHQSVRLAELLASAGRCEEAARTYLEAAQVAPPERRDDLVGHAARELIRSGHIDEGLRHVRDRFDTLGLHLASSPLRALPRILFERFVLFLRGFGYQLRPASSTPKETLARIDWCQSIGAVLPVIDTIRGFEVHSQGLRWALRAGEPARLARALVMEAGYRMGLSGGRDPRGEIAGLLDSARLLARAGGDPGALAWVEIVTGSTRWSAGDWRGTVEHVASGVATLRSECAGMSWEINFGQTHLLDALLYLGRVRELRAETLRELDDARSRGDLYAETMYTLKDLASLRVLEDRPDEAEATAEVLQRWTNRGFQVEHLVELYQQTEVALYRGRGAAAIERVRAAWPHLQRAQLLRVEIWRVEMHALRARAALAAADDAPRASTRRALVDEAARAARVVDRGPSSVRARVFNAPVAAAVALARGDEASAEAKLSRGIDAAASASMPLWEHAMRHARARLLRQADHAADALEAMGASGVARADRYVRVLTPGFGRLV